MTTRTKRPTDSERTLLARIALGEDSTFELKSLRWSGDRVIAPGRDTLADELAAFGNTKGGVMILGVDDKTRALEGIAADRLDQVERFVAEICNDSIEPPLMAHIDKRLVTDAAGQGVALLRVEVPRSLFVHKSPSGYFYRIGSSKREMSPEYLARLFQQRSQARLIRFDEQIVAGASMDSLSPPLWERFRGELTPDEPRDSLLVKLRMARRDEEGVLRPTVAGLLMAHPDPTQLMPTAYIQAVAYRGTSAVPESPSDFYQLDAQDITGPLDAQITQAARFVDRNMKVAAFKNQGRADVPQYDREVVFEALVNAVAHRDYSQYGMRIRLHMFADRLELKVPGGLANSQDIESLPLVTAVRNEAITNLLARCPVPKDASSLSTPRRTYMDRRGEGVDIILRKSQALAGRRPEYKVIGDMEVQLTIWAANAVAPSGEGATGQ